MVGKPEHFLGGLVGLLPGGWPAWENAPVQRILNYPTLVLQAGLIRDVRSLIVASRSSVYELGKRADEAFPLALGDYQGLMELNIHADQLLADLAGL